MMKTDLLTTWTCASLLDVGQAQSERGPPESLHVRFAELRGPTNRRQTFRQETWTRCADWSPQGCSESNSCLLAAINEGLTSRVQPPLTTASSWSTTKALSYFLLYQAAPL